MQDNGLVVVVCVFVLCLFAECLGLYPRYFLGFTQALFPREEHVLYSYWQRYSAQFTFQSKSSFCDL